MTLKRREVINLSWFFKWCNGSQYKNQSGKDFQLLFFNQFLIYFFLVLNSVSVVKHNLTGVS